jgi:hypothetical protein
MKINLYEIVSKSDKDRAAAVVHVFAVRIDDANG